MLNNERPWPVWVMPEVHVKSPSCAIVMLIDKVHNEILDCEIINMPSNYRPGSSAFINKFAQRISEFLTQFI